jgi:cobalt/nickel transport system ATP-binding protein
MAPLLELDNISFSWPGAEKPILDSLTLNLAVGRKVGLIGANGSGKTTLFHIIVGLLKADKGKVIFKGREIVDGKGFREVRLNIGLLFQDADDQLFSPTVVEDVAFGPLNLGKTPEDARQVSIETLAQLGLLGFENRITHKLSGGEKKLVALATILAMKPKALLLDEPTNNLDPPAREHLITIINNLDQACIIISHDWDFLAETCRETFAMEQGSLIHKEQAYLHNHHHAHPCGDCPHQHGK